MCPRDGYVCMQNSEIMCGQLGKATLGDGNKAGLGCYTLTRGGGGVTLVHEIMCSIPHRCYPPSSHSSVSYPPPPKVLHAASS